MHFRIFFNLLSWVSVSRVSILHSILHIVHNYKLRYPHLYKTVVQCFTNTKYFLVEFLFSCQYFITLGVSVFTQYGNNHSRSVVLGNEMCLNLSCYPMWHWPKLYFYPSLRVVSDILWISTYSSVLHNYDKYGSLTDQSESLVSFNVCIFFLGEDLVPWICVHITRVKMK